MKDVLNERLRQIFEELTSIDAVSGREAPVAKYILDFVKSLGLEGYTDGAASLSKGNSGNVIVPVCGGGEFFLAAHMDTPRSTANLKRIFREDRITSDGTTPLGVDDRGGLSSILYALERAVKDKTLQPCTLLFTVCEETSMAGSIYYKPSGNIKCGFTFDSYMSPGAYVSGTCGLIEFEMKIMGKSAHAGISPEKGVNAIQIAAEAMTLFPFGRAEENNTANIGIVNGGTATNVVCDEVSLTGELRSESKEHGEERLNQIIKDFTKVCAAYGGKMQCSWHWDFRPYKISAGDVPLVKFSKVAEAVGLTVMPMHSMGGSDANSFNAKGVKTINLGVGAQNPHGNDEFILYEDFENAAEIAYGLMTCVK